MVMIGVAAAIKKGDAMRTLLCLSLALTLPACAGVQLPHKKLSYAEACPGFQKLKCVPDDDPRALRFNLSPPFLEIGDSGPRHATMLGKLYQQPYRRGANGRYCGTDDARQPIFDANHIDAQSATGSFDYSYKLSSDFGVGADADLVQALTAAGVPQAATDKVKAAANAAYKRAKKQTITTRGTMMVVRLKDQVVQSLMYGDSAALAPCRELINANPDWALVKAMTVFHIADASSTTNIDDQIAADIKASLDGIGQENIAKANAAIERVVTEEVKTALSDRYIVWAVTWLRKGDV